MIKHLAIIIVVAACGGSPKPTAPASAAIDVQWIAEQAANETVNVSLVVNRTKVAIGTLSAAADDANGTPATCSLLDAKKTATTVGFTCGGTPAYNFYVAELKGNELVVTLFTGVENGESKEQEQQKEIKRIPVSGSTLTVQPYSPNG